MKKYILILITVLSLPHVFAQNVLTSGTQMESMDVFNAATGQFEHSSHLDKQSEIYKLQANFDFECNTDFWTVNEAGEIQQWSLINGIVSGGDIVLTGSGGSLALCGDINAPTFYSSNFPSPDIIYYDTQNGWITIPTTDAVLNNGGYANDQYYIGAVFDPDLGFHVSRILYYFNGTSLQTLEELEFDFFTVADIAVDGLGRAWIFRGDELSSVKSLEVYSSSDHLMSFEIEFNTLGAYGSFFLNNRLYIGVEDSITPIIITDENAELGTPISFPNNQPFYFDMASCQDSNPLSINDFENYKNEFAVIPNPTKDVVNLPDYIDIISVEVINSNGQLVRAILNNNSINLTGLPNGIYILKIITKNGTANKKIIKE
jgi:hypothetical protein